MYPFFRLISSLLWSYKARPLHFGDLAELQLRCMPWDIDMYGEMNNGRIITLYDLGRFSLSMRCGLIKAMKKNGWGLVVAGSTVMYRKRIRMFNKITMKTQAVGYDARWIYLIQSMWVKGQPCSSILLRTGITSKGKVLTTSDVMIGLDESDWHPTLPQWVTNWIESEGNRPWPPE